MNIRKYPEPKRINLGNKKKGKKYLTKKEEELLFSSYLIIEEKMDGKREFLETENYIIWIENLKERKNILYNIPTTYAMIDVVEKNRGVFLNYDDKINFYNDLLKGRYGFRKDFLKIFPIPAIKRTFFTSKEDLVNLIGKSYYVSPGNGNLYMEGIVIKQDHTRYVGEIVSGKILTHEIIKDLLVNPLREKIKENILENDEIDTYHDVIDLETKICHLSEDFLYLFENTINAMKANKNQPNQMETTGGELEEDEYQFLRKAKLYKNLDIELRKSIVKNDKEKTEEFFDKMKANDDASEETYIIMMSYYFDRKETSQFLSCYEELKKNILITNKTYEAIFTMNVEEEILFRMYDEIKSKGYKKAYLNLIDNFLNNNNIDKAIEILCEQKKILNRSETNDRLNIIFFKLLDNEISNEMKIKLNEIQEYLFPKEKLIKIATSYCKKNKLKSKEEIIKKNYKLYELLKKYDLIDFLSFYNEKDKNVEKNEKLHYNKNLNDLIEYIKINNFEKEKKLEEYKNEFHKNLDEAVESMENESKILIDYEKLLKKPLQEEIKENKEEVSKIEDLCKTRNISSEDIELEIYKQMKGNNINNTFKLTEFAIKNGFLLNQTTYEDALTFAFAHFNLKKAKELITLLNNQIFN